MAFKQNTTNRFSFSQAIFSSMHSYKVFICRVVVVVSIVLMGTNLSSLYAQRLSTDEVLRRAESFVSTTPMAGETLTNISDEMGVDKITVFNIGDKGFVALANYADMIDVVAYSEEGSIDPKHLPPAVRYLFAIYQREMDYALSNPSALKKEPAQRATKSLPMSVSPLLTSLWDQYPYYNDYCPEIDNPSFGNHATAGCGAIAIAQVLRYWRWPHHGYGFSAYSYENMNLSWTIPWEFGTLYSDYGASIYNYDNMPDIVQSTNHDVALLSYHCGTAARSYYNCDGVGSTGSDMDDAEQENDQLLGNMCQALVHHFGFKRTAKCIHRDNFLSNFEWNRALRHELAESRPVVYAGMDVDKGGHAFVCDGYDRRGLFHFNFGWGGIGNGYYSTSTIDVSPYQFSYSQVAFVKVQPDYTLRNVYTITYDSTYALQYTITDSVNHEVSVSRWQDDANVLPDTLVIPSIVSLGGSLYAVRSIENNAFENSETVSYIRFPETIKTLGSAFCKGCTSLRGISIDNVVVPTTSRTAFSGLSHPIEATIPCNSRNYYKANAVWTSLDTLIDPCYNQNPPEPTPLSITTPKDENVKVYPNPSHGVFSVQVNEPYTITIYDAMGRRVKHIQDCHKGSSVYSLSGCARGVYMIQVVTSTKISMVSMVIK